MSATELTEQINGMKDDGVRVVEQRLDLAYLSRGILVRVSVHGAGAFDRKLRFDELGIRADDQEMKDRITPGQKSYAPSYSGQLHSWATQCRQCLSRYTVTLDSVKALTASTSWRFLLFDAYDDFKVRWEELQGIRDNIVSGIEIDYTYLVTEAVEFYVGQAERSWNLIQSRYGYGTAISLPNGLTFGPDDRQQYLDWVRSNILSDFPTLASIREEVRAEYWVNVMFDSTTLAQADADQAQAWADQAKAYLETTLARDEQWGIEASRSAREDAIKRVELERVRTQLSETVSPFSEAMDQLLKELAGHITALTDGMDKHGSFRGRSLDRVERMSELYNVLGGKYLDNDTLTSTLSDLKSRANEEPTGETRDTWTSQIVNGLGTLRREVTAETAIVERRMQAHTRASALDL